MGLHKKGVHDGKPTAPIRRDKQSHSGSVLLAYTILFKSEFFDGQFLSMGNLIIRHPRAGKIKKSDCILILYDYNESIESSILSGRNTHGKSKDNRTEGIGFGG